jgi:hypothetical protein
LKRLLNDNWCRVANSAPPDAATGCGSSDGDDRKLATLREEIEMLEQEASRVEARLEHELLGLSQSSSGSEARSSGPESRKEGQWSTAMRAQLDAIVRRLADIPFDMARTPAATVGGILIKLRQLEAGLVAGSAESDVPLIQSIIADLMRICSENQRASESPG